MNFRVCFYEQDREFASPIALVEALSSVLALATSVVFEFLSSGPPVSNTGVNPVMFGLRE
jgi:hypothetical protein